DIELMNLIRSAIETIIISSSKTKRLEKLAYTDFLTGLSNRLFITERFEELQPDTNKGANITCFAIIDIDHFKQVNDTYGHDVGDAVLQQTARKIAEVVRISDCVSRVGGEEFALLLTDLPRENAEDVLEKIRSAVEGNSIVIDKEKSMTVTVSIGATELSAGDKFSSAYKKADKALYKSKSGGRNRVSWAGR